MNYYFLGAAEGYDWIWSKEVELGRYALDYEAKPMKDTWKIPNLEYVEGKGKKKFDVCSACAPLYFFSKKTLYVIGDILIKYGEILPVNSPKDNFVAFHCTNVIDALDKGLSAITWRDGRISLINKFVLRGDVIKDNEIFRIPESSAMYTFFSENIKNRIEDAKLVGFSFDSYQTIEVV
jgi:hypothetical protein